MRKRIIFILLVFTGQLLFGQSGEFKIYKNGLIYEESTMNSLKQIVDSLNLRFVILIKDLILNIKLLVIE